MRQFNRRAAAADTPLPLLNSQSGNMADPPLTAALDPTIAAWLHKFLFVTGASQARGTVIRTLRQQLPSIRPTRHAWKLRPINCNKVHLIKCRQNWTLAYFRLRDKTAVRKGSAIFKRFDSLQTSLLKAH